MSISIDDARAMPISGMTNADMPDNILIDDATDAAANVSPTEVPAELELAEASDSDDETANETERPTRFSDLGLPTELVNALSDKGLVTPFAIQTAAIPDALAGRDILGRAQTGSGKTLAFGLPMLTRLADEARAERRRPLAIVLVPTRELAMQVHDSLEPLAHTLNVRIRLVTGGMSMPKQIESLNRGVEILVATPGRLRDLVDRKSCDLSEVKICVLDEADQMADMGFLPEVSAIMDQMPVGGQRMLFSATLDNDVSSLVTKYMSDPAEHATQPVSASVTTMEHHVFLIDPKIKSILTAYVANRPGRTIIFVRTKLAADRIAENLRTSGVLASALHGGKTQGARNRVLSAFKAGKLPVLVATDVAARGIHVDGISLVLQVDPPADPKDYLHRAGRTARAGDRGVVVTLILPHQRRQMEGLAAQAGVDAKYTSIRQHQVEAGPVQEITGGEVPSGESVPEPILDRPEPRGRGGGRSGRPDRNSRGRRDDRGPRDDRSRDDRPRRTDDRFGDRSPANYDRRDNRRDDRSGAASYDRRDSRGHDRDNARPTDGFRPSQNADRGAQRFDADNRGGQRDNARGYEGRRDDRREYQRSDRDSSGRDGRGFDRDQRSYGRDDRSGQDRAPRDFGRNDRTDRSTGGSERRDTGRPGQRFQGSDRDRGTQGRNDRSDSRGRDYGSRDGGYGSRESRGDSGRTGRSSSESGYGSGSRSGGYRSDSPRSNGPDSYRSEGRRDIRRDDRGGHSDYPGRDSSRGGQEDRYAKREGQGRKPGREETSRPGRPKASGWSNRASSGRRPF